MNILHVCPANIATGGVDGIHRLVDALNNIGADAKILYCDGDLKSPKPARYRYYNCPYIIDFPDAFDGLIIFPEIWGNRVIQRKFRKCLTAINWQGVDVYNWHTPISERGLFLQNKDTMHITMSEYGMQFLQGLGLSPIKISDCLEDIYFEPFDDVYERGDIVLYNPVSVKLTDFQRQVMYECQSSFDIQFLPITNYSAIEVRELFRQSKLYIDFGQFSGRERLPREAVMCGCCILTSKMGAANNWTDNSIPKYYKLDDKTDAINKILYVLKNYSLCRPDFDTYRELLRADKQNYPNEVKELYNEILNHYSSIQR